MILLFILLGLVIWRLYFIDGRDILDTGIFCFLTFVTFFFYSMLHSIAFEERYFEEKELDISSIAINGSEFWIYTDDEIIREVNPQISEATSIKRTFLHPQKWWFINIGLEDHKVNINIKDLYEKRIPQKIEREL